MFIFKISIPLDFNSAAGKKTRRQEEENPSVCTCIYYLGPLFPVPLFCPVSYATTERLSHTNPSLGRKKDNQQDSNLFNREGGGEKRRRTEEGTPVGLTHVGRERELAGVRFPNDKDTSARISSSEMEEEEEEAEVVSSSSSSSITTSSIQSGGGGVGE